MSSEIKHFEKYRETIRKEILRFSNYYSQFKLLTKLSNTHLEELNMAPCFFLASMEAFFSSSILWAAKLLDEKSQKGIHNFIKFSKANPKIFRSAEIVEDEISILEEKLSKLPSGNSIKTRRDKYYAHFDNKFFFDPKLLETEAPILWGDFEGIIIVLSEVLNYFSSRFDGMNYAMSYLNENDLVNIFRKVKKNRKAINRAIERNG